MCKFNDVLYTKEVLKKKNNSSLNIFSTNKHKLKVYRNAPVEALSYLFLSHSGIRFDELCIFCLMNSLGHSKKNHRQNVVFLVKRTTLTSDC